MTAQILDRTLAAFRIGDPDGAYPIFDPAGSSLAPGRWNTPGSPLLYASEHYSTALLEKLVRGSGRLPPNQHCIKITIPRGLSYEVFSPPSLPGWDSLPPAASRTFGEQWRHEQRSLILIAPSVVARLDNNVLINPAHPEFGLVEASLHQPVFWDRRLFGAFA
ncbi:MAG: RES family NAD+ phosphorylase [Hyphomicrobiales bacterium]|nr:RES family NAD+ phosphorylase [Hyphomicrobiales bacterium]